MAKIDAQDQKYLDVMKGLLVKVNPNFEEVFLDAAWENIKKTAKQLENSNKTCACEEQIFEFLANATFCISGRDYVAYFKTRLPGNPEQEWSKGADEISIRSVVVREFKPFSPKPGDGMNPDSCRNIHDFIKDSDTDDFVIMTELPNPGEDFVTIGKAKAKDL